MNITRALLQFLLDHAGHKWTAPDLARAAGLADRALSAPTLLNELIKRSDAVAREGEPRRYVWFVPGTAEGRQRAQDYLRRDARGKGRRKRAAEPAAAARPVIPYPDEPLRYLIDDDGDMMITGQVTGKCFLLLPRADVVDLLAFARSSAGILAAA